MRDCSAEARAAECQPRTGRRSPRRGPAAARPARPPARPAAHRGEDIARSRCRTRCGPAQARPGAAASPAERRPRAGASAPRCASAAAARRRSRPDPRSSRAMKQASAPRISGVRASSRARTSAPSWAVTSPVPSSDRRWYWSSRRRSRSVHARLFDAERCLRAAARRRRAGPSGRPSRRMKTAKAPGARPRAEAAARAPSPVPRSHDLRLARLVSALDAPARAQLSERGRRHPRSRPTRARHRRTRAPGHVRTAASAPSRSRPALRRLGEDRLQLASRGANRQPQAPERALLAQPLGALERELRDLHRHRRLRREDVEHAQLVVGERAPLEAAQDDDARDRALVDHRHDEGALGLQRHARDRLEVRILRDVEDAPARPAERGGAEDPAAPRGAGRPRSSRRRGRGSRPATSSSRSSSGR